jgi:hypothetical protein
MISTVAACPVCTPSPGWLGLSSPVLKIRDSGLWQVNELFNDSFSEDEFAAFRRAVLRR